MRPKNVRRYRLACLLALSPLLQACATAEPPAASAAGTILAPQPAAWSEPANIGKAKLAAQEYIRSGAYMRDIAAIDASATAWVKERAPQVRRPALVFDIDETALSNLAESIANDWGFIPQGSCDHLPKGPCGFFAWEQRAEAPALAPTLQLVREAQALGVAIFFVTGRQEATRGVTAENLKRAGYANWSGLYLEPNGSHFVHAADYKAPTRASIEAQGYTIIGTVGDQVSDLAGGHAERGFKLPNPFYYLP